MPTTFSPPSASILISAELGIKAAWAVHSTPYRIRTCIAGMRGQHPEPLEERGVLSFPSSRFLELVESKSSKWSGRCSNPSLPGFNRTLFRLSYRSMLREFSCLPGQLPFATHERSLEQSALGTRKKPDVWMTPGFGSHTRGFCQVSQAQGAREQIR